MIGGIHVENEFDTDEVRAVIGDAVLHVYVKDEHVQVETITKQQIDKVAFEASLMLPCELQDRLGFKGIGNTDTDADTDINDTAVNEVVDPDSLVVVPDGVNLIDDDNGSDRDVVMEPVVLDLDTDDDHRVQENPELVISGDDDSNMISLLLANDIAKPAYKHDILSSSGDEQCKEDTPYSVLALVKIIDDRMSEYKRMNETTEPKLQQLNRAKVKQETEFQHVAEQVYISSKFFGYKTKETKRVLFYGGYFKKAVGVCFNQMPASKGIKLFGNRVVGAMEGKPVVVPINIHVFSDDDKQKALDAVNLIKEKRV
eukprot:15366352-Ditylum_brightwellii.AAC.1